MESKILIDINYSSRDPQVLIQYRDSDDPRDKLVAMFVGQAMPGVRNGYCRLERQYNDKGVDHIVVVPLYPGDAIKHIPAIRKLALENACIDTAGFKAKIEEEQLEAVNALCQTRLGDIMLRNWKQIMEMLQQGDETEGKIPASPPEQL